MGKVFVNGTPWFPCKIRDLTEIERKDLLANGLPISVVARMKAIL